jgi:hypothetical protein
VRHYKRAGYKNDRHKTNCQNYFPVLPLKICDGYVWPALDLCFYILDPTLNIAFRNPLWEGKSAVQAQEATAAQHAEREQSRHQAISDEEIDLDAGDDPDERSLYLTSIPQTK